ncbi:hypothetical protein CTZ27_06135 [Streptomyces griseocarneus]|nr:hypothetical protein CTZ27_06135 [Streptomyces griseocarneus]
MRSSSRTIRRSRPSGPGSRWTPDGTGGAGGAPRPFSRVFPACCPRELPQGERGGVAGSFPGRLGAIRPYHVPLGFVFRSRSTSKDEQAAAAKATPDQPKQPRDPQAPKGRPTPKRSEAASQRRSLASTPANRKDAAKRSREARRADMARQREALANGDERYLPIRDKGPVRRFARDYVDARYSAMEFFLPLAVLILILSMINRGTFQVYVLFAWMVVIALLVINALVLGLGLRSALKQRFPDENRRGAVAYGVMRTLQVRRLRLPKPQVKRGEKP